MSIHNSAGRLRKPSGAFIVSVVRMIATGECGGTKVMVGRIQNVVWAHDYSIFSSKFRLGMVSHPRYHKTPAPKNSLRCMICDLRRRLKLR